MAIAPDFYDAELRRHNGYFRAAADVQRADHVLDIGCGAGQTTRQAARLAVDGDALGVDVSAPMLERARQLSDDEGLRNVTFELADAPTHAFAAARFDLCISRFGTMFFADPVAAFANIASALRPGARLVLLVWQSRERNEWATEIDTALGVVPTGAGDQTGAFSLADPTRTRGLLTVAGFTQIGFAEVHEPVFYGRDAQAAFEAVAELWRVTSPEAVERLQTALDAHSTSDGVLFDSRAWIVTAVRPATPD
jgi:SAM-dependent methyltransferase